MKRHFEVVIAGGGIVGLSAAVLLSRAASAGRLRLRVIDAGPRPRFDPGEDIALRVSAISAGNAALYQTLGVWQRLRADRLGTFGEMHVWDGRQKPWDPEALHFDAAEFALPALGHIVENRLLQHALLEELGRTETAVEFHAAIESLEQTTNGFDIATERGDFHADVLVGADGADSSVRAMLGISARSWQYPQSALVTHMLPEKPHRDTAWQRFLPEGPLALLPLPDGRVSIVWSTTPGQAERAAAADPEDLARALTSASDEVLGELRPAAGRAGFPLRALHADRYVLPGAALIGDAAHNIHPLAGQGANLGIADAAALAAVLDAAVASGEHPGDFPVLRRYERQRKGANQAMLHFVDWLNRLFLVQAPPVAGLRAAGMRLFNRSGPLRRAAVETALGLRGTTLAGPGSDERRIV